MARFVDSTGTARKPNRRQTMPTLPNVSYHDVATLLAGDIPIAQPATPVVPPRRVLPDVPLSPPATPVVPPRRVLPDVPLSPPATPVVPPPRRVLPDVPISPPATPVVPPQATTPTIPSPVYTRSREPSALSDFAMKVRQGQVTLPAPTSSADAAARPPTFKEAAKRLAALVDQVGTHDYSGGYQQAEDQRFARIGEQGAQYVAARDAALANQAFLDSYFGGGGSGGGGGGASSEVARIAAEYAAAADALNATYGQAVDQVLGQGRRGAEEIGAAADRASGAIGQRREEFLRQLDQIISQQGSRATAAAQRRSEVFGKGLRDVGAQGGDVAGLKAEQDILSELVSANDASARNLLDRIKAIGSQGLNDVASTVDQIRQSGDTQLQNSLQQVLGKLSTANANELAKLQQDYAKAVAKATSRGRGSGSSSSKKRFLAQYFVDNFGVPADQAVALVELNLGDDLMKSMVLDTPSGPSASDLEKLAEAQALASLDPSQIEDPLLAAKAQQMATLIPALRAATLGRR